MARRSNLIVGGSIHSLSQMDGKYRVKGRDPSWPFARSFLDLNAAQINQARHFDAFQACLKTFSLGRSVAITDNARSERAPLFWQG
jgi:hypothetical protein